jgi:ABC-type transport system involved in multi-copper enzyme maturation permease subunit
MRLLRSEFLRARSRRLVPMVVVAGLLGILIGLGIAAFNANKPPSSQVAQAQVTYATDLARCERQVGRSGVEGNGPYTDARSLCEHNLSPQINGFLLRDLDTILQGIATFVILLGALLGASLGGADWTSNTMQTLLTWEPRRTRVYLVRGLVIAACVFAITVFLQVVFSGVDMLVAATRGSTGFLPSDFWRSVALTIGRTSVVASAFGVIAYAIAMIGRSTVASLGALAGYLILFEAVIAGFRPSIQGNLLVRSAIVIITHQPIFSDSGPGPGAVLLAVPRAWFVVAVYTVVIGVGALLVFRQRDVT